MGHRAFGGRGRPRPTRALGTLVLVIWLLGAGLPRSAWAQSDPDPGAGGGVARDAGAVEGTPPNEEAHSEQAHSEEAHRQEARSEEATERSRSRVAELEAQARQLTDLLADRLNEDVDLVHLLGVDPTDRLAVAVQVRQWKPLLDTYRETFADAGVLAAVLPPESVPSAVWSAQLSVVRLRAQFFALPASEQAGLIERYQARVQARAASVGIAQQGIAAADERAVEASKARARALAEAQAATSEALRLLREEEARLHALKSRQASYEAELLRREEATQQAAENTLGWRRKVAEFVQQSNGVSSPKSDALYDALRVELGAARDRLSAKLSELTSGDSGVPMPGEDRVDTEGVAVDRARYDALRAEVAASAHELQRRASVMAWQEARSLLNQTQSLNKDRLLLFPLLSQAKRDAVTSFGSAGRDQARAEWRQVRLVFRYHVLVTLSWIAGGDWRPTGVLETAWMKVAWLKLSLVLLLFWSWRRRGEGALANLEQDLRKQRQRTELQERLLALVDIYRRVRRPFEWLLLGWAVLHLLDPELRELLEVRVFWIVTSWVLGAATVVLWLNALAARRAASLGRGSDVSDLRLRSLRVVARTVVTFGLILSLSAEFVGRGTLHTWVIGSCWFAAIPIGLLLINWWKPVIFERLTPRKNRNRVARWIVSTQSGWQSFFAAAVGGIYLLGLGVVRIGRDYLIELELVRHVLAYLFQRSMSQQALTTPVLRPLDETQRKLLTSPDGAWIEPSRGKLFLQQVLTAHGKSGGVFAVVGEWGSGKSSLLDHLQQASTQQGASQQGASQPGPAEATVVRLRCPTGGIEAFRQVLGQHLGLKDCDSDASFRRQLEALPAHPSASTGGPRLILIDDAHRLLRPTIGGIQQLGEVLDATRLAGAMTWVFTFDHALFTLFERAYGVRPAFDEILQLGPWSEEQIRSLIEQRTQAAQLQPSFHHLLPRIVSGDEIDRQEKLERTRTGYYRMLWNYSAGNPAVATFAWADSLGRDEQGVVCVGPFNSPPTADLEALPDTSSFVLRALVRLELASEQGLAEAANVSLDQVRSVLRYARNKGYIEVDAERRAFIAPRFFRAVTRVLQRKHFLTAPL